MAALMTFWFFSREFVTNSPELQVVETWGFHHKIQFSFEQPPTVFKMAVMTSYAKLVSLQNSKLSDLDEI